MVVEEQTQVFMSRTGSFIPSFNDNMTDKNVKDALNAILPEDIYVEK